MAETIDLARIKGNVAKMVSMGAPEEDIDSYISSEGATLDAIRNFNLESKNINPSRITQDPQMYLQQELAKASQNPIPLRLGMNAQEYLSQAQPAFKLALEHPETLGGQVISPEAIQQSTSSDYADIYRRSALPLPGTQSTNVGGQLIPEIAGGLLDIASRPSTAVAGYILPKAGTALGNAMAQNPTTRRFLANTLPTFSKDLLKNNPMSPVYKTINGIQQDITQPLTKNTGALVKQGQKLVDAVHETMDNLGAEYGKVLKPFYDKQVDVSRLPMDKLKELGVIDENATTATVEDLWKGRFDLLKMVGNPWKKEELLKKTTLKEDDIRGLLDILKANVLNNVDKATRQSINDLDPKFSEAIKAGKGLLSAAYNPETNRFNTKRLVGIFSDKTDEGSRELFNTFNKYDKRVGEVADSMKRYLLGEKLKKAAGVAALAEAGNLLFNKKK